MQDITASIRNFLSQNIEKQALIFVKKFTEMAYDIPDLLRRVRLAKGFSQEGVSDVVDLSPRSYGRYERGETEISFRAAIQLAEFYKLTLDEFLHFGEPKYIIQQPQTDVENLKREVESLREQNELLKKLAESKDKLLDQYRLQSSKKNVTG